MLRRSHAVVIAIFLSAALCACASAARLVWDANTEPHLRGYKIHYGSASGQYTETVDVGNVTEWPIPDEWPRDRSYYFAATAYAECINQHGQPYICESGYSNEAVYFAEATPPSPATDVRVTWHDLGGLMSYDIGTPGAQDFGCAPYPGTLPSGFSALAGSSTPGSDTWGNYEYSDGSIMVWIPKFYYKVTSPNSIDIKGTKTYASTSAANTAGYALHRAFIDGGSEKAGFFIDKYKVSKTAKGAGYIASSIKDGLPISTNWEHNPIADLTASGGTNEYWRALDCAQARDGVDGARNSSSIFHVASRFQFAALAMLSLAHGQASTSTDYNAWYSSGSTNFPKGCNNNALGDTNDPSVVWESDGYSNACKTGSAGYGGGAGNVFAKSTHNGQNSGVADINGGLYEISLGVTAVATSVNISAATNANPCQITTATNHGLSNGDYVQIGSVGGMTQINDKIFTVTVVDADDFTLDNVDSSAFGTYTSGGTALRGTFYVAKQATAMKSFTSGNSGATDHWGATGVASMMDSFVPAFKTTYPNNGFAQRMGSGTNQVISGDTSGAGWVLAGLGLPKDSNGIDTSGTSVFGQDYHYQYIRNELCLLSFYGWNHGSLAGAWASYWDSARTDSDSYVGFRAACYADPAPTGVPVQLLSRQRNAFHHMIIR